MSEEAGDEDRQRIRLDPEERRQQILAVASRLFRDRLYSDVSISQIAGEAGVARGLLHHYFGSKRELYLEVIRRSAGATLQAASAGSNTPEHAWATAVDHFLAAVAHNPTRWLDSVNAGRPERASDVAAILDEAREILVDQTLQAVGLEERADDPHVRAFIRAWGGFVQELTIEWVGRDRIDRERVRAAMLTTLPLLLEHVLPQIERGAKR